MHSDASPINQHWTIDARCTQLDRRSHEWNGQRCDSQPDDGTSRLASTGTGVLHVTLTDSLSHARFLFAAQPLTLTHRSQSSALSQPSHVGAAASCAQTTQPTAAPRARNEGEWPREQSNSASTRQLVHRTGMLISCSLLPLCCCCCDCRSGSCCSRSRTSRSPACRPPTRDFKSSSVTHARHSAQICANLSSARELIDAASFALLADRVHSFALLTAASPIIRRMSSRRISQRRLCARRRARLLVPPPPQLQPHPQTQSQRQRRAAVIAPPPPTTASTSTVRSRPAASCTCCTRACSFAT